MQNGNATVFASGLPNAIVGIGGAIDVAFIGKQAYALVTLVGPDVLGHSDVGIYRVNGPNHELVANIGEFAINNRPTRSSKHPADFSLRWRSTRAASW